ncbi:MAG: Sua5 family C-terminal domain-containing protein, partial [Bdellovibrionota bacterium]
LQAARWCASRSSPTTVEHVMGEFPDVNLAVLDGGPCTGGIESTIVKINSTTGKTVNLSLLRKGLLAPEQIENTLKKNNFIVEWSIAKGIQAPGQIQHHYMPSTPLVICQNETLNKSELLDQIEKRFSELPDVVEGIEMIKPVFPVENITELHLSKDPVMAARQLYSQLRKASEAENTQLILWKQNSDLDSPLWESILERLHKAASLIIK